LNKSKERRLLLIALPAAFLFAAVALVAGIRLADDDDSGSDAPGLDGPRINDHWHALYTFTACGERQPNAPEWSAGVHTHADGIIHIHPFQTYEEGRGARLVKWFEYGGGELTATSIRMPGTPASDDQAIWENGEECPNGAAGILRITVNGVALEDWSDYIPQDGDQITIDFGPF
jgi:hypothetical protein